MRFSMAKIKRLPRSFCGLLLLLSPPIWSAGGVVGEAGSCMITIGFYTAHFSIYQPENSGNSVFCEDLPGLDNTVFVLEYLHQSLNEVPVDFRIIEDAKGFGQFVRWENIEAIDDLASQTVFFLPPAIHLNKRLTAEYKFQKPGSYIGIVTARHPTKDLVYHAVFPFNVGNTGYGYWPLVLLVIVFLQLLHMSSQGILQRLLGTVKAALSRDKSDAHRG
ncbi:MAG: hypothetical protein ACI8PP_000502 [Candidatus Pseudothioglobus sp.]|jgi:hypothetical protein